VARTLREQFALATLFLLIPVSGVIVWAGRMTYNDQLVQLSEDANRLAAVVAAHLDDGGNSSGLPISDFLGRIPLPPGAVVTVTDRAGKVVATHSDSAANVEEQTHRSAGVPTRGWTVTVGIPTSVAVSRSNPIYRRTVAISGLATLLMLAMEVVFLPRWLRSLKHLQGSADRVGKGDLRTPPQEPMPSREFEHLRDAFSEMVDNLRDAREAVARQVEQERRMREELQLLQQQIIRQERLAAIGVLLSGIAHELNNPLQAISGFAELLQRDTDLRPDVRADLAIIQKEGRRASNIIRNLSRFSRQQGSKPSAVYLTDTVASVVELRQRRFQEQGITLDVDEASSQPTQAVFAELQQVLLNFVINAEQALSAGGLAERRLTIRTRDTERTVRLEVEDTGAGVPSDDESKLFQPFFTTKPIGEGTGLGLSVSYGIIRSYGGTIGYHRGAGGGALFYFELPAAPDPPRKVLSS
jgi:C4-dicarboxylate-specific signal transduction histidine kinase